MSQEVAMSTVEADTATPDTDEASYYAGLERHGVTPLWSVQGKVLRREPKSDAVPHVWRFRDLRPQLMRAGELVSAEEAERRVLMLLNPSPAVAAVYGTTPTLYAGLQLVLPGETAKAHRHVASAFRFVIEAGPGAHTTIEGERVPMEPGDLVLTPNWHWHDHVNDDDAPAIWLDGVDLPLVTTLEAGFFEFYAESRQQATKPDDCSARLFTHGRLNPTWLRTTAPASSAQFSPVFSYKWRDTERALRNALADTAGSPTDGVLFEYTNPFTGGPVMPTLACFVQALRPGAHTAAHRHTNSVVYHVVRGEGATIVDGEELSWSTHDTFCVPGWAVHEHVNRASDDEAVLFSYSNRHVYEALGLYREEPVDHGDRGRDST